MAKAPSSIITVVDMKLERETKGAVRYTEVDKNENPVDIAGGARVGTAYIRKNAFVGAIPERITIEIKARS